MQERILSQIKELSPEDISGKIIYFIFLIYYLIYNMKKI